MNWALHGDRNECSICFLTETQLSTLKMTSNWSGEKCGFQIIYAGFDWSDTGNPWSDETLHFTVLTWLVLTTVIWGQMWYEPGRCLIMTVEDGYIMLLLLGLLVVERLPAAVPLQQQPGDADNKADEWIPETCQPAAPPEPRWGKASMSSNQWDSGISDAGSDPQRRTRYGGNARVSATFTLQRLLLVPQAVLQRCMTSIM